MTTQRFWPWAERHDGTRRHFNKAWWGGWWTRIGLVVGLSALLALGRASSPKEYVGAGLGLLAFYGFLMYFGRLVNYVELESKGLKVSQGGIVTPGGPTAAAGTIQYEDIVGIKFIQPRKVHLRYAGKDWRRRATVRTKKLYLEHADEFVGELVTAVESATGRPIEVERRA